MEIEQKILQQIGKTGFPLELRIAKTLGDDGWYVAQSVYFVDKDQNKGREIDIRALKNSIFVKKEIEYFVRTCVVLECKKSEEKPWVVFTSNPTCYDVPWDEQVEGLDPNVIWLSDEEEKIYHKVHPYSSFLRRGRSFFEPFKNNETGESIYKALTTVVKALIALKADRFGLYGNSACVFYPLVVFDGLLYEAYLEDGSIQVAAAESLLVSFNYESAEYSRSSFTIPIVKESVFEKFVSGLDEVRGVYVRATKRNSSLFIKSSRPSAV